MFAATRATQTTTLFFFFFSKGHPLERLAWSSSLVTRRHLKVPSITPWMEAFVLSFRDFCFWKEIIRDHQRTIRRSMRDIERERLALQNQEKKITAEIKRMAKQGQLVCVLKKIISLIALELISE